MSAAQACATDQVFATYELVEAILLELQLPDVARMRRLTKTCHHVTSRSTEIGANLAWINTTDGEVKTYTTFIDMIFPPFKALSFKYIRATVKIETTRSFVNVFFFFSLDEGGAGTDRPYMPCAPAATLDSDELWKRVAITGAGKPVRLDWRFASATKVSGISDMAFLSKDATLEDLTDQLSRICPDL